MVALVSLLRRNPWRVQKWGDWWGLAFAFFFGGRWLLGDYPHLKWIPLAVTGLFLAIIFGHDYLAQRNQHRKRLRFPPEFDAWMEELGKFAEDRTLMSRVHPELLPLWERSARALTDIEASLNSPEWKRKAMQEPWRSSRQHALELAFDVMADGLWLGRSQIRKTGQRRKTFERRMGNPEWGARERALISQGADELERLAHDIRAEVGLDMTGPDTLSAAFARLEALRAAEAELDEDVPSLQVGVGDDD